MQKQKKYISTAEAAKRLGISRIALFQRIKKGVIKAEKMGRNYMVDIAALEEKFDEKRKKDIDIAVTRAVTEYGEAFRLLGSE